MTEGASGGNRPSPAPALERRFDAILRTQMHDVPLVNPALRVQALGFRPHGDDWLGVLVTPWFMNLVLLPRKAGAWRPLAQREARALVFPAGVFEFIGAQDAEIGNYLACSLYSPMFEFASDEAAAAVAAAALDALFDAGEEAAPTAPGPAAQLAPAAALPTSVSDRPQLSRRGFFVPQGTAGRRTEGSGHGL